MLDTQFTETLEDAVTRAVRETRQQYEDLEKFETMRLMIMYRTDFSVNERRLLDVTPEVYHVEGLIDGMQDSIVAYLSFMFNDMRWSLRPVYQILPIDKYAGGPAIAPITYWSLLPYKTLNDMHEPVPLIGAVFIERSRLFSALCVAINAAVEQDFEPDPCFLVD